MNKGKFEKVLVDPYLPRELVPPEYVRDILDEASKDFPLIELDIEVPHKWTAEEYQSRYEELEHQMMEIISWRVRWFGNKEVGRK